MADDRVYTTVAALTDIGIARKKNEDSYLLADFRHGTTFENEAKVESSLE
jgi:hypothetical protein